MYREPPVKLIFPEDADSFQDKIQQLLERMLEREQLWIMPQ